MRRGSGAMARAVWLACGVLNVSTNQGGGDFFPLRERFDARSSWMANFWSFLQCLRPRFAPATSSIRHRLTPANALCIIDDKSFFFLIFFVQCSNFAANSQKTTVSLGSRHSFSPAGFRVPSRGPIPQHAPPTWRCPARSSSPPAPGSQFSQSCYTMPVFQSSSAFGHGPGIPIYYTRAPAIDKEEFFPRPRRSRTSTCHSSR